MRRFLITLLLLLASFVSYSQNWLDDSNFENKINEKSAFGDDETNVVVVEFWVEFNKQNAFEEWKSLEAGTSPFCIALTIPINFCCCLLYNLI